jgi:hypothetical protein
MRALVLATALLIPLASLAVEEPAYQVVKTLDKIEIRQYAPYVVAEVLMAASADEAGNQAFPILAGYIFGKNEGERKMEMTAPVTQTAAPVKMSMTAPVTQAAAAGGGYIVQFVLPRDITMANAPKPTDPRVQLREVPSSRVAVIRYTGTWSQENYEEHLSRLKTALNVAGLGWTGEPVFSRYNGPWTPWFMRRNEIWLNLKP